VRHVITKDGNDKFTVVTLDKLECNVRSNQSLDDNVVTHRVMRVADHPNVFYYGSRTCRETLKTRRETLRLP
jgi:hypothetical protein